MDLSRSAARTALSTAELPRRGTAGQAALTSQAILAEVNEHGTCPRSRPSPIQPAPDVPPGVKPPKSFARELHRPSTRLTCSMPSTRADSRVRYTGGEARRSSCSPGGNNIALKPLAGPVLPRQPTACPKLDASADPRGEEAGEEEVDRLTDPYEGESTTRARAGGDRPEARSGTVVIDPGSGDVLLSAAGDVVAGGAGLALSLAPFLMSFFSRRESIERCSAFFSRA